MGWAFFFCLTFVSISLAFVSGVSFTEFVYPNFTASNLRFVDSGGSFLFSRNGTFKAAMFNPGAQQIRFYLCVIHVESNTIIWSANRDAPVSSSGVMALTANGINITEQDGSFKWSTPGLKSPASSLQLTETGNLVLLDRFNGTVWGSFDHPTDTIVSGQRLPIGSFLSSASLDDDLSTGGYTLSLSASDASLQWKNLTYWKLSMDTRAYTNSNYAVEYMALNQTGLYLFGHNGSEVVIMVNLSPSNFRTAKLDHYGQFIVSSFSGPDEKQDFVGPVDECRIPYICGRLGVCTAIVSSNTPVCSCPTNFNTGPQNSASCVPSDSSHSLAFPCNSTNESSNSNTSSVSYMRLGRGLDYFANDFSAPVKYGVSLSVCEDLCSGDCSCLGIFYDNSSGSCYVLENELGSIILETGRSNDRLGYIKVVVADPTENFGGDGNRNGGSLDFPVIALVLIPLSGILLLVVLGFVVRRKLRVSRVQTTKSSHLKSSSSGDLDAFAIPGLPIRFDYEELEIATGAFKVKIGAGGFGTVYKGILPDKTVVAVKKITNVDVRGKKDFCTELAIIGNIHHVNLVKLKGFCAQGRQWLLVYEYMNRGSLDRTLFGSGPVIEWQERVEIALGAARGLAYLHSGCEKKIIHCDIKPENILLQDHFQAKISDFGLSKLLSPEQSALFTTMRGTRGYLAPEWLTSSAVSDKTDVYSYGMVLLELVSGRKNCVVRTEGHSLGDDSSSGGHSSSSLPQELVYFPLFALEMHEQGRYLELADPRLEGRVTSEEVQKLVRIALCCVHEEPALRPNMVSVVSMLEGETSLGEPRMESLNFLRFYGRRYTEASTREDAAVQNDVLLYPQANTSYTSSNSPSNNYFSYISSQQVSGPR